MIKIQTENGKLRYDSHRMVRCGAVRYGTVWYGHDRRINSDPLLYLNLFFHLLKLDKEYEIIGSVKIVNVYVS